MNYAFLVGLGVPNAALDSRDVKGKHFPQACFAYRFDTRRCRVWGTARMGTKAKPPVCYATLPGGFAVPTARSTQKLRLLQLEIVMSC